ncbi:MAG: MoaD/ThiS family protein [Metallosphaera yellowstonensis]|uniref:Sulfur transfer protein involved in thiamine biosynthesis n=1 Tax=Metallosphaera yellowstonensis MK1 TaxID=671065 RepID=H2C2E5_9CREN|nr:MoaD/ThiS family protein [Metallosphaera yellowstonensis]EHP70416.1 sulfur transfer protein involved in thiamine biosynthesis [Metallosphaera yellowstonensis MK1]
MKVKVYLARQKEERVVSLDDRATVRDLIKILGLRVQGVVVLKDGVPVLEEERLKEGDNLTVVLTASGG